jgi:hypothetical protein
VAQLRQFLRPALLVALTFALLPSPALSGVDVGHDDQADFSQYKTYAWGEGGWVAMKSMTEANIHKAVEQELKGKGITKVDAQPDLHVITYASGTSDQSVDAISFAYVPNTWTAWFSAATTSRTTTKGRLVVDLVDVKSGHLVWRGIAMENLGLDPNTQSTGKKVFKVVKKMFEEYPPKPKK